VKRYAHFWQRRFYDFNVWSPRKKNEKLNYMHFNPVKRGLVKHPKEWLWSSYRFYWHGEKSLCTPNPGWKDREGRDAMSCRAAAEPPEKEGARQAVPGFGGVFYVGAKTPPRKQQTAPFAERKNAKGCGTQRILGVPINNVRCGAFVRAFHLREKKGAPLAHWRASARPRTTFHLGPEDLDAFRRPNHIRYVPSAAGIITETKSIHCQPSSID